MGSTTSRVSDSFTAYAVKPLTSWFVSAKPDLENASKLIQHHPNGDSRSELEVLRQVVEDKDQKIAALVQEVRAVRDEAKSKEETAAFHVREEEGMKRQTAELQMTVERLESSIGALEGQLQRQTRERKNAEDELRRLKTEHSETRTLLDARSSELRGAQAFLTKADSLSGADVIRMVDALNAEILQDAAFMADSFEFGAQEQEDGPGEVDEASRRIGQYIGPELSHLLRSMQHQSDPMLIQISFQACMAELARWIITAWSFDNSQDEHFAGIFARMLKNEAQAVSGRWRALTRRYVQMVHNESEMLAFFASSIAEVFYDVLVLADCKNDHPYVDEMLHKFSERATVIVKMALRLNKAIGEDITSADFEVITIPPEVEFDPAAMDDAFGDSSTSAKEQAIPGHILCTTDLGLRRVEKVLKGDEIEWKQNALLKPKVALASLVEGMEREE